MEIERKFLVKKIPEILENYRYHDIEQAYLCVDPVVRVRKSDDEYYLTYKGRGLIAREEYNLPLKEHSYRELKAKASGKLITKRRYIIPLDDHKEHRPGDGMTAELDIFEGEYEGLVLVEVEFATIEDAEAFAVPDWFGREVSGNPDYSNAALALKQ